jgi:membrane protease YdiL (CAAX protease family)
MTSAPFLARAVGYGSLARFLGWAVLAWAICQGVGIFLWIPRWSAFPNPFAALAGCAVIFWGMRHVLRREGLSLASIGFDLRPSSGAWFGAGLLLGAGITAVALFGAALFMGGKWTSGAATWLYGLAALNGYFWASLLEELLFRGFLLQRLIALWGRPLALGAIALAFGLFHLPGMSGIAALKMIGSTAMCSLFYSALVLRSGSLWSAVAAHLAMNWVLHTGLGGTGKTAFLTAVYPTERSVGFDVAYWSFIVVLGAAAWLLLPKAAAREPSRHRELAPINGAQERTL